MNRMEPNDAIRYHTSEIGRLRRAQEELRLALEKHLAALRVAIPPGASCDVGDHVVSVHRAAWHCTIRRPEEVPLAFIRAAPDKARILEHYRRTGEVLPGVSYSLASSSVVIRARGAVRDTTTERPP